MILSYLRTDSTGLWVTYQDTVRYTFKDKEVKENKRKKDEKPKIDFLSIKPSVSADMDLGTRFCFEFGRPIDKQTLKHIRVSEKVDTVYQPMKFEVEEDPVKVRTVYVDAEWKAGGEYQIEIDSATIYDIYGRFNDKFDKKFKVKTEESYGKLFLMVKGVEGNTIIQLYKSESGKSENGKRKYQVVREQQVGKDGQVTFELLPEGKYMVRAVLDVNNNGEWDTGLYLKHQQPEEIIYLPIEISVKQNFDIEQEFDLKKKYEVVTKDKDV